MKPLVVAECLILGVLITAHSSLAVTCTINLYNADDINDAGRNCDELILNGIGVPPGETLTINLKQGAKLIFQGTLTWGFYEWDGPLINITGTDVEIFGSEDHVLDVRGTLWWDGLGGNGGKIKPIFFIAHGLINSLIHNLTVKNPANHAIWIEDCDGVIVEDIFVDSKDGDTLGGHNTDGFNVWKSNNVVIQRIKVYNQDDCVAIKSGTNVLVTDSFCFGGHGISIGSVGGRDYNVVENVTISNSQVIESDNGIRIKTVYGVTGSVTNVTFVNITLKDINNYGIIIHGDYGSKGGIPTGGVPIKEFTLENVTGNVKESGVNVFILVSNASDWSWSDVDVYGGEKPNKCDGIPEGSNIDC